MLNRIIICFTITIYIMSCSRNNNGSNPPPPAPLDTVVKGTLYTNLSGSFKKIDLETSTILWSRSMLNNDYSFSSEIDFDAGYLYHGNYKGITCYNSTDGSMVWQYSWDTPWYAASYHMVSFKDSLLFFSSGTSDVSNASLYCLNKRTGAFQWKHQLDSGATIYAVFFSMPLIVNDKIIALARNTNGDRLVHCYSLNGQLLWKSPVNNNLVASFRVEGDKVFSSGVYATAIYHATGQIAWQTNLGISIPVTYWGHPTYFHQNKLFVIEAESATNAIKVLDYNTGTIIGNGTAPGKVTHVNFRDGIIYTSGVFNDTTELNALDANTLLLKWKVRPFNSFSNVIVSSKHIMYNGTMPQNGFIYLRYRALNKDGIKLRDFPLPHSIVGRSLYIDEQGNIFKDRDF